MEELKELILKAKALKQRREIKKAIEIRDEKVYRKLSIEFSQIWLNKYTKKLDLFEKI